MSVQRIATRYAKSLIDLAEEQGKLDRVLQDVESFDTVCQNRDFELMLKSPIINADKKEQIFEKLFAGKYDELTMAFLRILLKKGREPLLVDIAREFVNQFKEKKSISSVKLTTAAPLGEKAIAAIKQKIAGSTATNDHIELETAVDPSIIGGFVMEIEDKLYDASVAHKLSLLKKDFKDNLYISQIVSK